MNNIVLMPGKFLSTLSLRRATVCPPVGSLVLFISIHALLAESDQRYHRQAADRGYFYPRSPCGERLQLVGGVARCVIISIHALLAESDCMRRCTVAGSCRFLSTLSLRRATRGRNPPPRTSTISIHALLAESDGGPGGKNAVILHFYPRSPCGERRFPISAHCFDGGISIHALLAESDNSGRPHAGGVFPFLSTLSLRRATYDRLGRP